MTLAEVIDTLQTWIRNADDEYDREEMGRVAGLKEALHEIKRIEPCEDCINRSEAIKYLNTNMAWYDEDGEIADSDEKLKAITDLINGVPSAQPKTGHCKDCKYFEYDSAVKVDGAPLIVAHEICSRWGNGCKTREDGCCFLFEPQESEGKE